MKQIIFIMMSLSVINFQVSAQLTGDYRSVASGSWNDATNWQIYNGSSWVNSNEYPGQNPGSGNVNVSYPTEIYITETIPHAISSLSVIIPDYFTVIVVECEEPYELPVGKLRFSSETSVSLTVSGNVFISGLLGMADLNGSKTHKLLIGGNLNIGRYIYHAGCDQSAYAGDLQVINGDDKLNVEFNGTSSVNLINALSGNPVKFHDVTFNGLGVLTYSHLTISGNANFISGIVKQSGNYNYHMHFLEGSTVSGGSNVSFFDGIVGKIGNEPFTFPIGNEGYYGPLTISAPGEFTTLYAYYDRNLSNMFAISDTALSNVSNCEWWSFQAPGNVLTYPIDVTVGWASDNRCGTSSTITNVSSITLARFSGIYYSNTWDGHSGSGIGTVSNGSVTWIGLDKPGNLTLGNTATNCSAPSGLKATNITQTSASISWPVVAGAVSYDVDYKITGMGWTNLATATTAVSFSLTGLVPSSNYEWKVRTNCSSGSSSYRLAYFNTTVCNDIYETNNTSAQAKTIGFGSPIAASISSASDVDWFRVTLSNNSPSGLKITLSNLPGDFDLYLYDKALQLIGSSVNTGLSSEVIIPNSISKKGNYFIKVAGKNGAFNYSQCYNLLAQLNGPVNPSHQTNVPQMDGMPDGIENTTIYPNPASEFVLLRFKSSVQGATKIELLNSKGQLVKQQSINLIKGRNQVKIPVHNAGPGMYVLRIRKDGMEIIKRFAVAR